MDLMAAINKKFDQTMAQDVEEESKEAVVRNTDRDEASAFGGSVLGGEETEFLSLRKEIKSSDAYNKPNLT